MDNVTLSTAQRLTAANFPIPPMKSGQMWYCVGDEDKKLTGVELCCFFEDSENSFFVSLETGVVVSLKDVFFKYYAATPAEILKELGERFVLSFFVVNGVINWTCAETMPTSDTTGAYFSPAGILNPAEACALAYLDN